MPESRKISILLPFYNEERYIAECIESIQSQDYAFWELIAIDDRSTDTGPEVVRAMAAQDSRIRYFLNPDKGVISALQYGLEQAAGQLVTRMDADDRKTPDNLGSMAALLTKRGLVATGMVKYFSDEDGGVKDGYRRYESWINDVIFNEECFKQVYRECTIPSPCWLVHRDDLIRAGAFVSPHYPEDYDLNLRFHKAELEVRSVKHIIHHWRDHGKRVTRNDERYADNFFIDLKLPYFIEIEIGDQSTIILWGAGKKAKAIAKRLVERKIQFRWISNNTKKTGLDIYGIRLEEQNTYQFEPNHKLVIAISSPSDQEDIRNELIRWNLDEGKNFWWFC